MRRIALAGVAAVALAGTASYAVTAWTPLGGRHGPAGQAGLSTAIDAEDAPGGPAGSADPATENGTSGSSGSNGSSGTAGGSSSSAVAGQAGDGAAGGGAVTDGLDGTGRTAAGSSPATGTGGTGGTQAGSTSTSTSTGGVESAACAGRWEPAVQGAPVGFAGGDRAGDYLWHGLDGFHLRVTHRGDRRDVFAGYLRADRPMAIRPVRLEGRDAAWLSADRRTLGFRFFDYGHIDGVDFVTACATRLTVSGLTMDGHPLPADRVYLGHYRAHPAQVPFTITRRPAAG